MKYKKTIPRSAFPERLFEFAFNAAFIDRNAAILVGTPDIPSQDAEKWLGYDVVFEIERTAGVTGSIALQHKVSRYVNGSGSSANADFRAVVQPEYFAFPLDVDQFNIIQSLAAANMPGIEFVYCAPLFVTRKCINDFYAQKQIEANSIWIDIAAVPPLDPSESHSVVYDVNGSAAWVLSQPARAIVKQPVERFRNQVRDEGWNAERVAGIYTEVLAEIDKAWPLIEEHQRERASLRRMAREQGPRGLSEDERAKLAGGHFSWPTSRPEPVEITDLRSGLEATSQLLANYLGMSWIVEVCSEPN